MADHRTTFTAAEWIALRVLVQHLGKAHGPDQKRLRDGMRGLGFYISDHAKATERFLISDLQSLLTNGELKIYG